ncbi:hypothetical protein D3C87_1568240 [compost metagenome]
MAERIVDGLETIKIEIEDTEGLVCTEGRAELAIDDRLQSLAIIKTGQRVGHRGVAQLAFGKTHGEIGFLEPQKRGGQQRKTS